MNKPNIQQQVSHDTNLRAGLVNNHKKTEKFVVAGKEVTVAALVSMLDERIAAAEASDTKRREHSAAVANYHATVADTAQVLSEVRAQLISQVGKTAPELAAYGIAPRKSRQAATVEERLAIIAKNRATRKARGTRGPKARLAIKGTVPLTPPPTEPIAQPAAPSPAPVTAPPGGITNGAGH